MKRRRLLALVFALWFGPSHAQVQAPNPLLAPVTLQRTLEVIGTARREMWLIAPTLRDVHVARALRARAQAGVTLRLLITNRAGYTAYELELARVANVDARWLKERFGATMLVVDDRAAIVSLLLSGVTSASSTTQSIEVSRPEMVAPLAATLKQLFQTARRLR
jgi:phosphatidylserine/phosphatidylglycerophosphate/cardiolipin synthase-like enzyme